MVKYAFHMSWFLLILGGSSLFEKKLWGLLGGAMLLYGIAILVYTGMTFYLKKTVFQKPGILLLITMGFLVALIFAHFRFGKYELAGMLVVMALPVFIGWLQIRTGTNEKSMAKKKR